MTKSIHKITKPLDYNSANSLNKPTKLIDKVTKPIEFVVSNNNLVRALKNVVRHLQKHRVPRTMKTIMYFEKPSEKKLRKSKECEARRKKSNKYNSYN